MRKFASLWPHTAFPFSCMLFHIWLWLGICPHIPAINDTNWSHSLKYLSNIILPLFRFSLTCPTVLGWSHKLYAPPLNFPWLFGRTSPLITSDHQPPRGLSGFQSWKIYPLWLPVNHGDTEMAIRHSHLQTTRWADRLQRHGKADRSADSRHPKSERSCNSWV